MLSPVAFALLHVARRIQWQHQSLDLSSCRHCTRYGVSTKLANSHILSFSHLAVGYTYCVIFLLQTFYFEKLQLHARRGRIVVFQHLLIIVYLSRRKGTAVRDDRVKHFFFWGGGGLGCNGTRRESLKSVPCLRPKTPDGFSKYTQDIFKKNLEYKSQKYTKGAFRPRKMLFSY